MSDLAAAILVFSAACIGSVLIGRYIARMGPQPRRLLLLLRMLLILDGADTTASNNDRDPFDGSIDSDDMFELEYDDDV